LPVFEPGDDVFDAGPDPAVHAVEVVADSSSGVVALWCGDRCDAAVAAIAECDAPVEELRHGVAGQLS
jgi:hypothetical protein